MNQTRKNIIILAGLILLATAGRLIPHAHNFTPVLAIGLFAAFYFKNRYFAIPVVIAAMVISDLAIGFDSMAMRLTVYGSLLVPVLFGRILRKQSAEKFQPVNALGFTLGGSVLFFLTTNFTVWLTSGMYAPDFTGLALCYINAIPFFQNTVLGDLFYSGALFTAYLILTGRIAVTETASVAAKSSDHS